MTYQTIWFALISLLLVGYVLLDGFDLGVGILHLFARDEKERDVHVRAIGPVWDGNEVWLLTGGGALFAAFPPVYAAAASSFYLALVLLLLALIARATALEFRAKIDSPAWRRAWDLAFGLGSLAAAFLLGTAFGNVLRGVPLDRAGNPTGGFLGLLNPYALLVGAAGAALCTLHGAAYLRLKSSGDLNRRLEGVINKTWTIWLGLLAAAAVFSAVSAPRALDGFRSPVGWVLALFAAAGGLYVRVRNRADREFAVFCASAVMIAAILALISFSLFPVLLSSSIDPAYSLTAFNSSSSELTLRTMFYLALVGVPLVLGYTIWVYCAFAVKVEEDGTGHY